MDYLASLLPPLPAKEISVKALTFLIPNGTPSFTYHKIASPIKPGHVLVEVKAAALNPLDVKMLGSSLMWSYAGEKGLGRDFCGIVEEVGKGVEGFEVGDRVCGMYYHFGGKGTFATNLTVNVKTDAIVKAPDALTDEEAAAYPLAFGSAWQSVHRAKLDKSSRCIVLGGATSTGLYAIQILKKVFEVDFVVATCSSSSEELVRSLGADEVIDYKSENVVDRLIQLTGGFSSSSSGPEIPEIQVEHSGTVAGGNSTSNGKFNLVVDCVGGNEVYNRFKDILLPRSTGSAYSTLVGDQEWNKESLGGPLSYAYNPRMIGRKLFGGSVGINYYVENVSNSDWIKKSRELFNSGKIKVTIDEAANWKEWKRLFEKQQDKRAHGKLVLIVDPL